MPNSTSGPSTAPYPLLGGEPGQPEHPDVDERDADDHQRLRAEPLDQHPELACEAANNKIVIGRKANPVSIGSSRERSAGTG